MLAREQPTPHGLWAALARRADAPTVGVGDVWRGLERRLLTDNTPKRSESWAALAARVDPTQYRPHAVPDVAEEQIVEGDQTYTVIRSPRGNYLRLTPPQRELWQQMDGTRTVAQLATQAFVTFKQLLPVGDLVTTLKAEGFLIDQPVGIYRALGQTMVERTPKAGAAGCCACCPSGAGRSAASTACTRPSITRLAGSSSPASSR